MSDGCSYTTKHRAGPDLTETELIECMALLDEGDALDLGRVKASLTNSPLVILVRAEGRIVGLGANKGVRSDYADTVIRKSGHVFDRRMQELGYIVTHPDHQRRGIAASILKELLGLHEGPAFATTDKETMRKRLGQLGFERKGQDWQGRNAPLSLWILSDPSPTPPGAA
jgi:GNAT superfamily N-acetyltransferase